MPRPLPPDAYFAGLIDGEGYVALETRPRTDRKGQPIRSTLIVRVAMTHRPTIELLACRWPSPIYTKPPAKEGWLEQYIWQRVSASAREVLIAIRPYAVTKHDAVEECIRFLKETGRW